MNSAAAILSALVSNSDMWEMTEDKKNGSIIDEEDLICSYMVAPPLDESNVEGLIVSDQLLDENHLENFSVLIQIPSTPDVHLKNKSNDEFIALDVKWEDNNVLYHISLVDWTPQVKDHDDGGLKNIFDGHYINVRSPEDVVSRFSARQRLKLVSSTPYAPYNTLISHNDVHIT